MMPSFSAFFFAFLGIGAPSFFKWTMSRVHDSSLSHSKPARTGLSSSSSACWAWYISLGNWEYRWQHRNSVQGGRKEDRYPIKNGSPFFGTACRLHQLHLWLLHLSGFVQKPQGRVGSVGRSFWPVARWASSWGIPFQALLIASVTCWYACIACGQCWCLKVLPLLDTVWGDAG